MGPMSTQQPFGSRAPSPSSGAVSQAGRAASLLTALVATAALAGLVVAGIALPGVAAAGRAAQGTVDLFNDLPAELAEQPLSQQSRILFSDGSLMATFYYQNRIVVGLDAMPQHMQDAIVAVEDARFYEHGGVDPEGMGRAAINNAAGSGGTQGASTLTQQWIKNVLLDNAISKLPPNPTQEQTNAAIASATTAQGTAGYARKLREVKLAIAAEKEFTKPQILERYLNIANFGDAEYGVETASRHYFNRGVHDISLAQAATLAGVVQQPEGYNPRKNPVDSQRRRDVVLDKMLVQGKIDQAAHDEAVGTPMAAELNIQPSPSGCMMSGGSGYFCDYAVRNLLADPVFAPSYEERRTRLYRGGLTITTTLDPVKQRAAEATLAERVQGDGGVSGSIVSIEPGTGRVVTMAQNTVYNNTDSAPVGATGINYNVDKQSGGGDGWQPGSNFKPIVLATWLEKGNTLLQTVNAQKKTFANSSWKYGSCLPPGDPGYTSKPYGPSNAGDSENRPSMPVLEATYNSVNTAYVQMENQLQLCDVREMATRLNIVNAATGAQFKAEPSMVLGAQEVAPLAVANMYATFANRGTYCRPLALDGVTDAGGQAVPITQSSCQQVLDPDIADGINYTLQNVLTKGTAAAVKPPPGREAAGKTGTTDKSVAAWFTGYTPNLATSVWLGFADGGKVNPSTGKPGLNGAIIGGKRYSVMYGGTLAAPVWKQYVQQAMEGMPAPTFTNPPQRIIGYAPPPPRPRAKAPSRPGRPSTPDAGPAAPPAGDPGTGDAPAGGDQGAPPPAGDAGQPPTDG